MNSINCRGRLLQLHCPVVMGILNATPDSFYDGYLAHSPQALAERAGKMVEDGAVILDLGGQSTRPGSTRISAAEEADRLLPVVELVSKHLPDAFISVDTYYAHVATQAVRAGAHIVNDVSGGNMDEYMLDAVASLQVPYVCMHMRGTPETMQQKPRYDNVLREVLDFLSRRIHACRAAGIKDVIADPGFGFGKSIEHNYALLRHLKVFDMLDVPILVGISRKGMLHRPLNLTPASALNATTAAHVIALRNGAKILRTHDPKEAKECIDFCRLLEKAPAAF